nr:unnamed protein product [Spirometra erinaceieuropaei]
MSVSQPHLTDLPEEILERIFTFLSYHEVSRLREVCRLFDCIGKEILKRAFRQLEEQILCYRKELKQQLPRRESERRKHPLSGRSEVLSAIETRVSLLDMSIMRYTEEGYCAFFPGKVLDELRHVFCILKRSSTIPRPQEFLHELRDISSMAMEYFDEALLPSIHAAKGLFNSKFSNGLAARLMVSPQSFRLPPNRPSSHSALLEKLGCASSIGDCSLRSSNSSRLSGISRVDDDFESASMGCPENASADTGTTSAVVDHCCDDLHYRTPLLHEPHLLEAKVTRLVAQTSVMRSMLLELTRGQRDLMERNAQLHSLVAAQAQRIRRLESRAAVGDSARPTRLVEPARQNADVLSRKRPLLPAASSASSMEEGNSDPSVSSPRKVRVMEVTQPASASSSDSI